MRCADLTLLLFIIVSAATAQAQGREAATMELEANQRSQPSEAKKLSIPLIDISGETQRHVIVAAGTESDYRGQVNTVVMGDGKTMFATWPIGHGGKCGPLKRSDDGGLTWSDLLPTPKNWGEIESCPCIFRLSDPQGVERLFVFAGRPKHYHSVSLDGGATWSPMEETGLFKPGGNTAVITIHGGRQQLLLMQRSRADEPRDGKSLTIWQAISSDGGLTWENYRKVCEVPGAVPCEPDIVRSPDGRQRACLMRENSRRFNSLVMFSDDEGASWSKPRELPASLTGDRHMSCYTDDGRLVVVFRDRAVGSPTYGHYVAWIRTYDDIHHNRDGQYRVKLLHSHAGADCGYSGLERLPDGTLVATTYIKYRPGPKKHSIVSVRFKPVEIDAAFEKQILGRPDKRDTVHWTGDEKSANWNDAGNWDLGVPDKHDVVVFGNTNAGQTVVIDGIANAGRLELRLAKQTDRLSMSGMGTLVLHGAESIRNKYSTALIQTGILDLGPQLNVEIRNQRFVAGNEDGTVVIRSNNVRAGKKAPTANRYKSDGENLKLVITDRGRFVLISRHWEPGMSLDMSASHTKGAKVFDFALNDGMQGLTFIRLKEHDGDPVEIRGFDDDDFFRFRADPFKSCDKGKEFRIDAVKFAGWPDDGKASVEQRGEYWYLKPATASVSKGIR